MTPADLVIRDAEAADLPAVRALLVETWHATYDGIYGWQRVAEITNAWHSLENLGAQLGRENGAFLVALVGSEIVATASARTERDRAALLTRLYVLPAWQGVGIGRTLLQVTMESAAEADALFVTLMGDQVEDRRTFIESHARDAQGIDV